MPGDPSWSSVVGLYHFDGSSTWQDDTSDSAAPITTVVGSYGVSLGTGVFDDCAGRVGTSLSSRGEVPHHTGLIFGGDFTIEGRVFRATNGFGGIVGKWGTFSSFANNWSWIFYWDTNAVRVNLSLNGTSVGLSLVTGAIPLNTWTAIALDRNGSDVRLYVDGVMVASGTLSGSLFNNTTAPMIWGTVNGGNSLANNAVDEWRFTNGVARYASNGGYTLATSPFPDGAVPIGAAQVNSTQVGLHMLAKIDGDVNATQVGLHLLSKHVPNIRVTQMGLLMLARGAAGLLVPDPLSLSDGGRSMVIRQRLVNMYSEPTPQGPTANGRFARPGLYEAVSRGSGPHRAIFTWKFGIRVCVSDDTVYINDFPVGTVPNPDDLPVRWAVSDDECVVTSGGKAYYVTTTDVTEIVNDNLLNVIDVKWLAGRFVYILGDRSGRYFYSESGDALTINGLGFISAESNPDPITAGAITGDAIAFFGERSVEFHYATSNADAPYQRSQGRKYDKGCKSIHSVVLCDNVLIFAGSDRSIYRAESVPIPISNDDVADRLRKVPDESLPLITAFTVKVANHEFYVINLPEQGTWAYDFSQRTWAEWKSWNRNRFRVNVADDNVMGDIYSGKLLAFDGQRHTDLDEPLERVCSSFAPLRSGTAKNFNVALMTKRGVGLATGAFVNPVVEMRFSDNQDSEWSQWIPAPLGPMGDRSRASLALWIRLGSMIPPGRQFEFRCTDPVEFSPYEVKINEVRP